MDLTNERLETGQPIHILTLMDMVTKQSPAVEVQTTFAHQDVVNLLDRLTAKGEQQIILYADNGQEFILSALKDWARHNKG
jgi:putative transposase